MGVFFETDRKSRNWVCDLNRELGLVWAGMRCVDVAAWNAAGVVAAGDGQNGELAGEE